jgi:hypothetical protein
VSTNESGQLPRNVRTVHLTAIYMAITLQLVFETANKTRQSVTRSGRYSHGLLQLTLHVQYPDLVSIIPMATREHNSLTCF